MSLTEARNDCFVYRDAFFVEVGIGKRHTRASMPDLKHLLLPKKGSVAKDQVAHWYEAQLVHYGLPRTKDKSAAKLRLIDAVNSKALKVPTHISNIEAELKKQYAAIQRKSKVASGMVEEGTSSSKKRKAIEDQPSAKSTKFTVKFGDFSFEAEQTVDSNSPSTPKKTKPSKSSPTEASELKESKAISKPTAAMKAKAPAKTATAISKMSASPTLRDASTPVKKAPRKSQASSPPNRPVYPIDDDTFDNDDEPPPYSEYDSHSGYSSQTKSTHIQLSGKYTPITTRYLLPAPAELGFYLSHARGQLWGSFTVGTKQGLIKVENFSDTYAQYILSWRAEDVETGHLSFRRDNDGWLQFDGEGTVTVCLNKLIDGEDVQFNVYLEDATGLGAADVARKEQVVDGMVGEWDAFVSRAYRR